MFSLVPVASFLSAMTHGNTFTIHPIKGWFMMFSQTFPVITYLVPEHSVTTKENLVLMSSTPESTPLFGFTCTDVSCHRLLCYVSFCVCPLPVLEPHPQSLMLCCF